LERLAFKNKKFYFCNEATFCGRLQKVNGYVLLYFLSGSSPS
jgi:hypothetical protein